MRTLYRVAGVVLLCDQLTKFLAVSYLKPLAGISVVPNIFNLSYVENTGIAFGFFQGHPEFLTLLITASVLALFVCAGFFKYQPLPQKLAYGFIVGGSLGNWVDRMRVGHVIDFLDFHISSVFHWPVFNIADSFITIGVFLFIGFALRGR